MTFQPDAGLGEPVPKAVRGRPATLMPGFAAVLAVLGLALACCGFVNGMTYDVGGGSVVRVTLVFSAFSPAFIVVVAAGLVALSNMFTGARGPAVVSLGLSLAGLVFTVYIFVADYTHEVSSAAERGASPPVNMSPGPGGVLLLVISALMAVIALLWVFLIGSADRAVAHAATPAGPMFPPPGSQFGGGAVGYGTGAPQGGGFRYSGGAPLSGGVQDRGEPQTGGGAQYSDGSQQSGGSEYGGGSRFGGDTPAPPTGTAPPSPYGSGPGTVPRPEAVEGPTAWGGWGVAGGSGAVDPGASHSPPSPAVQQRIPTGDEPPIDGDGDTTVMPKPPTDS